MKRALVITIQILGLAVAYFFAARIGLQWAFTFAPATPVWPSTGIALAVILLAGYRLLPGVLLGAFFGTLSAGTPPIAATMIAIGNTLEIAAGVWLLRRAGFHATLERQRDVLHFITLGALISPVISATIGVTALGLEGVIAWSHFAPTWATWWVGNLLGALLIAPLILTWVAPPRPGLPTPRRAIEIAIFSGLLYLASEIIFLSEIDSPYLVFPFVIWAALRLGPRGAVTAVLVIASIALIHTERGQGPFSHHAPDANLIQLQMFASIIAITGMFLATIVAERARTQHALEKNLVESEQRVGARTAELATANAQLRVELAERQHAQDTLRENELRYRMLFEQAGDGIFIADAQGNYIDVNDRGCQLLGYTRAEILQMNRHDLMAAEDVATTPPRRAELRAGKTVISERRLRRKDGSLVAVEITSRMFPDGRMQGITRDITARQLAARAQTALYQISEAAHTAPDLDELFRLTHAIIADLMPARNFYIALYDAEKNLFTFPYYADEFDRAWAPSPPGRGMTSYVLRTGKPLRATPEIFQQLIDAGEIALVGTRAVDWLGVPLKTHNAVIGVLAVQTYSPAVRLNETNQELLLYVSTQIAAAIERKRADQQLRASEQEYRLLFHRSPIGIFHYNANLRITDCNDRFLAILQSTRERIVGLDILRLRDQSVLPAIQQALKGQEGFYEGFYRATTSDAQIWVSLRIAPILDESGNVRGGVGIVEDITERHNAEARVRATLREKEILLKEIHHRVKNNLNIVSGLLELQTELIADPAARTAFAHSQQRIRAMALIHEKLYQSSDLARVNIAEYIQDLVDSIRIGNARADAIQVVVQVDDRALDLDVAIVCGMLVNELVTNAFKYADATEIRVALTHADQRIALSVRDNGVGLPRDFDWRRSPSLGLQLAQMFAAQLTGTLELDSTGGTAWHVTFPLETRFLRENGLLPNESRSLEGME